MEQGILWLRELTVGVQLVCLMVLARRGLVRRYPVFWGFVLLGLLRSLWILHPWRPGGVNVETAPFQWLLAVLYGAVAIESCVAQARHFRSLFSFAKGAILLFAVLSAAAGGMICLIGVDLLRDGGPVMLMCSSCCVLLILSTALFSTFPVTMRPNVRWHVFILFLLLAGDGVAVALGSLPSPAGPLVQQAVDASCSLLCYLLWTVKLVPAGECFLPLSAIPAEILARLMARPASPVPGPPQPASRLAGGGSKPRCVRWHTPLAHPDREQQA